MTAILERLPGSPGCFICDNNGTNPRSLKLKVMWNANEGRVEIPFTPDQTWCGYSDVVHGGLVAAVLDEGMAWVVKKKMGGWAFTADFQLRYKKPLVPGREYLVVAEVEDHGGRKINTRARVMDQDGQVTAQATAIFLSTTDRPRPRQVVQPQ